MRIRCRLGAGAWRVLFLLGSALALRLVAAKRRGGECLDLFERGLQLARKDTGTAPPNCIGERGQFVRGLREIDSDQAAIVRRIFPRICCRTVRPSDRRAPEYRRRTRTSGRAVEVEYHSWGQKTCRRHAAQPALCRRVGPQSDQQDRRAGQQECADPPERQRELGGTPSPRAARY